MSDTNEEAQKLINFYRVVGLPSILLVDPVTGGCLLRFQGFVDPDRCTSTLVIMYCPPSR